MPAENVEALRPKLEQAQRALEEALDEACETDVARADGAELIRLEESLTIAREAARNAIAVLQRLHREHLEHRETDETRSEAHRVFVDDRGVQWDAFCVYPSRQTSGSSSLPPPYHEGWLSIQCQDEIRRVTPIPAGWRDLSRDALCQLLEKAVIATRRMRPQDAKSASPESSLGGR
jgi:hypothetical protein